MGLASRPQRAKDLHVSMIANTVSLSWRIGRAIALARKQSNIDQIGQVVVDAVGGSKTAKVLFSGKIIDLRRRCVMTYLSKKWPPGSWFPRLYKGHTIGEVVIAALSADEGVEDDSDKPKEKFHGTLIIPFKNENLYAEHTAPDGQIKVPNRWNLSPRTHADILADRCSPPCPISLQCWMPKAVRRWARRSTNTD